MELMENLNEPSQALINSSNMIDEEKITGKFKIS